MTAVDECAATMRAFLINRIRAGSMDYALGDPDVLSLDFSPEVNAAIVERLKVLADKRTAR